MGAARAAPILGCPADCSSSCRPAATRPAAQSGVVWLQILVFTSDMEEAAAGVCEPLLEVLSAMEQASLCGGWGAKPRRMLLGTCWARGGGFACVRNVEVHVCGCSTTPERDNQECAAYPPYRSTTARTTSPALPTHLPSFITHRTDLSPCTQPG